MTEPTIDERIATLQEMVEIASEVPGPLVAQLQDALAIIDELKARLSSALREREGELKLKARIAELERSYDK